jgi:hypothetical protein
MKERLVVIGIDDIARIFKDYAGSVGFPEDAQTDTLLFHPANRRMRLRISAESLNGNQPPEEIRFQLKRTFLVNNDGN